MKVAGRMGRGRRKECESGRADFRAKMKVDGQEPVRRGNKIFESSLFCPERNSLSSHLRDNWGSESVREARGVVVKKVGVVGRVSKSCGGREKAVEERKSRM